MMDKINTRTALVTPLLIIPLLIRPPNRTHPLNDHELVILGTAYREWIADQVYVDSKGSYRQNGSPRKVVTWNKAVKALFPENQDFHRAAQLHKSAGVVIDPTQAPRFISSSNGTTVGLRVVCGNTSMAELATVTLNDNSSPTILDAFEIADLLIDALYQYVTVPHGYLQAAVLLNKIVPTPIAKPEPDVSQGDNTELDVLAASVADEVCIKINQQAPNAHAQTIYPCQRTLEEVIRILQNRV